MTDNQFSAATGDTGRKRAIELLIKLQAIGNADVYRLASEAQQMLELPINDPAQAVSEPVAWRWRRVDESTWVLVDREPRFINPSHFVTEPLYAAQPPAAPVEREPDQDCEDCGQPIGSNDKCFECFAHNNQKQPGECSSAATSELLPCPFCGADAHFYENEVDFVPLWSVHCDDCNADMDVCEATKADAAAAWNGRRAQPQRVWQPMDTASPEVVTVIERAMSADKALGKWMSAALEDDKVCTEMKADILEWFEAHKPTSEVTRPHGATP